ncbi:glycosyltransferase [Methylotenera sp.]|uniref:glycosyltransferase n=1 Tax=Methylotenera sp. TaxID=2051956 RepID=UPI0027337D92|nr:glycosyltransferase [Methylotenera sp.]MDP3776350.1 glycosyltransferase [Methylotenera sp.]
MRILIAHNYYQQAGGEDAVVAEEVSLLERHDIAVEVYAKHNDNINVMPRAQVAIDTMWSRKSAEEISAVIKRFKPDVIHTHNTFPLISPSLYYAAASLNVPVVQTLHNFRLFCAQAMFMRDGKVCEDCLGKLAWRGVMRGCYRGSKIQSAAVVGMQGLHRMLGTYQHKVTRYIALNQFCSDKFIEAGLPKSRMAIKPNFIDLPLLTDEKGKLRQGGLFVGRLSKEKGLATLAEAASIYTQAKLEIIGIGPEERMLKTHTNISLQGWKTPVEIYRGMRNAAYLVMPSIWYENFPRTLVEAFACGLPVIASRLGAMAELIDDGFTGLLFEPGNAKDLAEKLQWADSHPDEMLKMGREARWEYETKYTSAINFKQLMGIYKDAIHAHRETTNQSQ